MTGIFHGNTEVLSLNVGGQEIAEVYVGPTKVWPSSSLIINGTWWATGEQNGASLVNSTVLLAQPDPFGGNNGISIANDGTGSGSQIAYIRTRLNQPMYDGLNVMEVYVKSLAGDAERWAVLEITGSTPHGDAWVNITDDDRDDLTRVGTTQAIWSDVSCTALGDGWFFAKGTLDMTDAASLNTGRLQVRMADNDNSSNVPNTVPGAYSLGLHKLTISAEGATDPQPTGDEQATQLPADQATQLPADPTGEE